MSLFLLLQISNEATFAVNFGDSLTKLVIFSSKFTNTFAAHPQGILQCFAKQVLPCRQTFDCFIQNIQRRLN